MLDRRKLLTLGGGLALSLRALGARALEASSRPVYAVQLQTLKYASPDGVDLLLDLYFPQGAPQPLPLIVFLHGGGWSQGTRTTGPDFKRFFAQDGIAIAAIDYRLTPAVTFPKNAEDVKTAVRWLRANAATYNLDPRRIGLWGTSAGGHLATLAAVTRGGLFEGEGNLEQSSAVQCVLDAYGPVLFAVMDKQTGLERATLQAVNPRLAQYQQSHGDRLLEGGDLGVEGGDLIHVGLRLRVEIGLPATADIDPFDEMDSDPEVMRYIGDESTANAPASFGATNPEIIWKTVGQGAATSVLLAAAPLLDGVTGRYFEDCNEASPRQPGGLNGVADYALDPDRAARLWQLSADWLAS